MRSHTWTGTWIGGADALRGNMIANRSLLVLRKFIQEKRWLK